LNPNLQRALLLFQQSRFELAEPELRQALASDPDDTYAHALLALCLAHAEKFDEATQEARQAIHLAPDFGFAHYALANVLHDRRRYNEAVAAVSEALRLEPEDSDYCALLSQIRLDQRNWPAALEAAERGLQFDPSHVGCTNLRAIALVKLGRKAEAGATIDAALARNPADATTHANQGWAYLEQSDPRKALEHFQEALRIDPTNEWARAGIVEALKARNIVYGLMLRYFLWMAKLPAGAQWGVIIGGYFLNRMLASAARSNPDLAPWLLPIRILYMVVLLLTWTADPLFNLMLRVNRFGRLALTEEQTRASSWFGVTVFLALGSLGMCFVFGFNSIFLISALVFGMLMIPVAAMFKASEGWPRTLLMSYTGGLALAGLATLGFFALAGWHGGNEGKEWLLLGKGTLGLFITASIIFMWGANVIIPIRPKR
jgi:tetratricopeptide (TPR) repeat protein